MPAPILGVEEYQFGDAGVLLNGAANLPFVDLTSINGLDSAPFRTATTDQEGRDGGYVDMMYETMRTVTLEGTIYNTPTAIESYLDSLKVNFAPAVTAKPLYFKPDTPTAMRCVFGKSAGIRYSRDSRRRLGMSDFQVQIICEDPRIYAATEDVLTMTVNTTESLSPLLGNRDTTATIKLTGPLVNPSLSINMGPGAIYEINTIPNLTAGEYIDIDLNQKYILKNGNTSIRHLITLTNGWPVINPGNLSITLAGTTAGSTGNAVFTTRAAWR
jgi:phage-related protein